MRVSIVPSFHYDVVYLKSYREYLDISFRIIDEALEILDGNESYRFTVEQVILLEEYWNRFPERRRQLVRHAASGRLAFAPGMYVMPDMNHPDGESLFMQAKLGKEWLREHIGVEPTISWIADCWGHHAQLPQILSQAGYTGYAFWRCMRRDVRSTNFVWIGIDGTAIATHWLARGYSGLSFPDVSELANALDLEFVRSGREAFVAAAEDLASFGDPAEVLLCNGGDFRHPQQSALRIVESFNTVDDGVVAVFSTPDEYFARIDWSDKDSVDGEFNSSLQGTFTTNIDIKQGVRRLAGRVRAVEAAAVALSRDIDTTDLWKRVLKQQFHDTICGTICDDGLVETRVELKQADEAITTALSELTPGAASPLVFNPLGFARTERVDTDCGSFLVEMEPFGFATPVSGRAVQPADPPSLPLTFENDFYRAEVDERGYLTSLVAAGSDRELIDRSIPAGPGAVETVPFGSLSMQMDYGDLWLNFEGPISGGSIESSLTQNVPDPLFRENERTVSDRRTFFPTLVATDPARGTGAAIHACDDDRVVVRQRGVLRFWRISIEFTTDVCLQRHTRHISYRTSFTPTGAHYRLRVGFPTTINDGRIRHEIPFGIQLRGQGEHAAQTWADLSDDTGGLALLNAGIPGNNVDRGIMLLTVFRSVDMDYKAPSLGSRNTGVPQVLEYAVLPHAGDSTVDIIRHAHTFNNPPLLCGGAPAEAAAEPGAVNPAGFHVGSPNVIVSGVRPSEGAVFVRLYEATGTATTDCTLAVPSVYRTYRAADGLQRPTGEPQPSAGSIQLSFGRFEIKNMLFYR